MLTSAESANRLQTVIYRVLICTLLNAVVAASHLHIDDLWYKHVSTVWIRITILITVAYLLANLIYISLECDSICGLAKEANSKKFWIVASSLSSTIGMALATYRYFDGFPTLNYYVISIAECIAKGFGIESGICGYI
jgi:uncharacterized PurR-regulated membrane protein YhhQ (DUF165 family)